MLVSRIGETRATYITRRLVISRALFSSLVDGRRRRRWWRRSAAPFGSTPDAQSGRRLVPCHQVLPRLLFFFYYRVITGFYYCFIGCMNLDRSSPGFIEFQSASMGFTGFYWVFSGFYWILLGFTRCYVGLLGFTGI